MIVNLWDFRYGDTTILATVEGGSKQKGKKKNRENKKKTSK